MFPKSEVRTVSYYGEGGPHPAGCVITVEFVLDGQALRVFPPRAGRCQRAPGGSHHERWVMTDYHAVARRVEELWLVDIDGVGVVQARNMRAARKKAVELVETVTGAAGEIFICTQMPVPFYRVVRALMDPAALSAEELAFVLNVSPERAAELRKSRYRIKPAPRRPRRRC